MLTAVVNSWSSLAKLRPPLVTVIVTALAQWSPRQLDGLSALSIKSVEKSIRILLSHISRSVVHSIPLCDPTDFFVPKERQMACPISIKFKVLCKSKRKEWRWPPRKKGCERRRQLLKQVVSAACRSQLRLSKGMLNASKLNTQPQIHCRSFY